LTINPSAGTVTLNNPLTFYENDTINTTTPGSYSLSATDIGAVGAWPPGGSFPASSVVDSSLVPEPESLTLLCLGLFSLLASWSWRKLVFAAKSIVSANTCTS
jgi:hypothetical protein